MERLLWENCQRKITKTIFTQIYMYTGLCDKACHKKFYYLRPHTLNLYSAKKKKKKKKKKKGKKKKKIETPTATKNRTKKQQQQKTKLSVIMLNLYLCTRTF